MDIHQLQERFPVSATKYLILQLVIKIVRSPRATATVLLLSDQHRVQFATWQADQQFSWFQQEYSVRTTGPWSMRDISSQILHKIVTKKRSSYICLDEAPEVADNKTVQGKWHGVIYPVEVTCGTVPCSSYINGRELACVVCSKWWLSI